MTTNNFLTPLLDKFTADINAAVANAQAEIFAILAGVTLAPREPIAAPAPVKRVPASGKPGQRKRGRRA